MAVPKRRHSKSRRDKKRTGKGIKKPQLVKCPQCGEFNRLHYVCSNCGYYKGKQVINLEK